MPKTAKEGRGSLGRRRAAALPAAVLVLALGAAAQPPGRPQVTAVRHWSSPNLTRIVVELEAEVTPRGARLSNPERVYFDLPDTRLSPELKGKTFPVGDEIVQQVRVAQTQIGVTRVVVDLSADAEHTFTTMTTPPRVAVELRKKAAAATAPPAAAAALAAVVTVREPPPPPMPPPKAAAPNSRGERNLIRALGLKIGRVVIDPGHGGHDTGTIGPSGLMEKELALDVATRLGELISERAGSEVIFTRTDDSFVALEERTALANEKQADLFLSVHANSSRLKTARGVETYYLNLTADREALEVAARENAASQKSIHELEDLLARITLTEKIAESREFALQVQRSLHAALSVRNRGVRKAPFVVLIGARMPSVLAEISFLSNARDEKLLKTPAHRQKIAEALYAGLTGYARSLGQMEVAAR
jgi:N-acetylmuramoyl-L-alanine amidase